MPFLVIRYLIEMSFGRVRYLMISTKYPRTHYQKRKEKKAHQYAYESRLIGPVLRMRPQKRGPACNDI